MAGKVFFGGMLRYVRQDANSRCVQLVRGTVKSATRDHINW